MPRTRKTIDRSNPEKDKKEFLEELIKKHGNCYACYTTMPNWSYTRFYNEQKNDPEFAKAINDIKMATIKWVEDKMFSAIEEGDRDMTKFFLRTQAGYSETQKIEANVTGGLDIEAQIAEMKKALSEE